jgi:hypothetical protein
LNYFFVDSYLHALTRHGVTVFKISSTILALLLQFNTKPQKTATHSKTASLDQKNCRARTKAIFRITGTIFSTLFDVET